MTAVPVAALGGDGPFGARLTRIAVRIALRQAGRRKSVAWLDVTAEQVRRRPRRSLRHRRSTPRPRTIRCCSRAAHRTSHRRPARGRAARRPVPGNGVARFFDEMSLTRSPPDRPPAGHREDPPPPRPVAVARGARAGRRRMTGPARRFDPTELSDDPCPDRGRARRRRGHGPRPRGDRRAGHGPDRRLQRSCHGCHCLGPDAPAHPRVRAGPLGPGGSGWRSRRCEMRGASPSEGRPLAVRGQALALVFVVAVASSTRWRGRRRGGSARVPDVAPSPVSVGPGAAALPVADAVHRTVAERRAGADPHTRCVTTDTDEPIETPEATETDDCGRKLRSRGRRVGLGLVQAGRLRFELGLRQQLRTGQRFGSDDSALTIPPDDSGWLSG